MTSTGLIDLFYGGSGMIARDAKPKKKEKEDDHNYRRSHPKPRERHR